MLKNIDFKNGKLVFGEGEHTYQEVIDDFQNASEITIVTFNISKTKDGALLKKLSEACKRGVKSRIITNIPKRFPSYYRNEADSYARAAHTMIESYIRLLDSSKFNMHLDAYFNFSNHSKIIMTDNIIYCGSANYSDESKNNLECGFVSRDKVLIKDVNDKIIEDIIYESIPYYEYNIAESIACMRAAQRFCEMSKRKIFDAAYTYWSDYETNFEDKIIS